MENFVLTANAVLPLFLIMALGYGIRRTPLMDDHTHQMMNKLIFKLFLPILLFKNISTSDLNALSGSWVYLYALVSELATKFCFRSICFASPDKSWYFSYKNSTMIII